MSSLYIGIASVAVSAVGTGVSLYGASQSAAAQKSAAAQNARLSKLQASATAAVQRFQAQLDYQIAMANVAQYRNNATVLRQQVKTIQNEGFEGIKRMGFEFEKQNASVRAAYGKSGIAGDTGSPLNVSAYNAGMQQLARMDVAYKTNMEAEDTGYQAKLMDYQAAVTQETAKQYQYAIQMADWSEKMGISAANIQANQQIALANSQFTAALGNAAYSLASTANAGISNYSTYRALQTPTYRGGIS
jgi:hypothetical protein